MQFPPLSEFAKQVLISLCVLFGIELVLQNWIGLPIAALLAWDPGQWLLKPWTLLTCYLVQGSNPMGFLFQLIALFFFLPPTQQQLGRKGIQRLVGRIVIANAIIGTIGILIGAVHPLSPVAFGLSPIITALIVLFGLSRPDATIYLLVFPVKAAWMAWGSGLFALFSFLTHRNLSELLLISAWITAFLFTTTGKQIAKRGWKNYAPSPLKSLYNQWLVMIGKRKKKPKLTVHDGGQDDPYIH